ncbi:MAG: SDR family oxidoreductase [Hyphomonadaceae bacterium]|nr:SDR family oxidoreductase [Hyphomonadaceae bacterium]
MQQDKKSIFITGAASGIGAATAKLFAARGWFVGLADIAPANAIEADIPEAQRISLQLDVRDSGQWRDAITRFGAASGGRMHVLFNNAGVARHGRFDVISEEDTNLVVDVNLKGVLNGVRGALPLLSQTPGARIVNTASAAAIYGLPKSAVYAATKFAVRGLSQSLDIELGPLGVRCIAIAPWFIETPLLDTASSESNKNVREVISGLKVYPVELVAEGVWKAAHGKRDFIPIGKDAIDLAFAARFFPGTVRRQLMRMARPG